MEPLLRFENVSKHYPNGVHALKGVSFEMAEGEFISVIGPSGSGKSPSCAPSTASSPSAAAPSGWTARRFPPSGGRLCGSCGARWA